MKAKIKALTGKMCRLDYKINGCYHSFCGKVGRLKTVRFVFLRTDGRSINVRFDDVTDIKQIKIK